MLGLSISLLERLMDSTIYDKSSLYPDNNYYDPILVSTFKYFFTIFYFEINGFKNVQVHNKLAKTGRKPKPFSFVEELYSAL